MVILESKITGEHCVHKIRAMKELFVPEEDNRHYNCNGLNKQCENYRPVKNYQIPINDVRFG